VPITADSIVRTTTDAVSCELDGEAALLNVRTGDYYGLDEVGASVWRIMSQPHTVAEIINEITSEYDVDTARCESDLVDLLSELAKHGLVEISDSV
jgi:coenzyme PQQ synthesis protein D (PqqD)